MLISQLKITTVNKYFNKSFNQVNYFDNVLHLVAKIIKSMYTVSTYIYV